VAPAGSPADTGAANASPGSGSAQAGSIAPLASGAPTVGGLPQAAGPPLPPPLTVVPERLSGYVWPVRRGRLTGYYDYRRGGLLVVGGRRIHEGIDITTFCGDRVRAAHSGTVLHAGRRFGPHVGFAGSLDAFYARLERRRAIGHLPIVVVIDDGNGYRSSYVHLSDTFVEAGDTVAAGDRIGLQGATGNASGCHLHYELIRMDGPWMRVAPERVEEELYPSLVRERVDPLRILSLDDRWAPRPVPGIDPPKVPPGAQDESELPAP
jgi:murein DD-endopeptidase MepM/ murein hydrolase activator NlpD